MTKSGLIGAALAAGLAAGCATNGKDHKFNSGPSLRLTGAVVEDTSTATPTYHFVDLEEPDGERGGTDVPLEIRSWYTTNQNLKVAVKESVGGKFYNYEAVVGPQSKTETTTFRLVSADKGIEIASGWVIAWGTLARAATEWVTAASEGSTIALERVSGTTERVYFLQGLRATVTCGSASPVYITSPGYYVQLDYTYGTTACTVTGPTPIAGSAVEPTVNRLSMIMDVANKP